VNFMRLSHDWKDYKLIDAGNGEKLESWNGIILRRPDPQAMWPINSGSDWKHVDGFYHRSDKGGGYWDFYKKLDDYWTVDYKNLKFKVSPTNFKHTGLFPEQAVNWDFMMDKIKNAGRPIKVLNLFAYTGGATMACSSAGAIEVVHVDAAKGMVAWAKENMELSGLSNNRIRFIVDDCLKFVLREARRGNKYDAIIMDPPSYGRGPNGEVWKFENNLYNLITACMDILSDEPLFFLINAYTTGISSTVLYNILKTTLVTRYGGVVDADEVGLPIVNNDLILPCGICGRWQSND
jgi:23S rRNA (cytosine1962-C5)-methyltransferase